MPAPSKLVAAGLAAGASAQGVCDIAYNSNTPCVAAHSLVRALYANYNGPLYQVIRSDGKVVDIPPVAPGGVANSAAQDAFCNGASCFILQIYDQVRGALGLLSVEGAGGGRMRGGAFTGTHPLAGAAHNVARGASRCSWRSASVQSGGPALGCCERRTQGRQRAVRSETALRILPAPRCVFSTSLDPRPRCRPKAHPRKLPRGAHLDSGVGS